MSWHLKISRGLRFMVVVIFLFVFNTVVLRIIQTAFTC